LSCMVRATNSPKLEVIFPLITLICADYPGYHTTR
jgi:hypothetical protein